jgi:hypothetical protein
MAGSPSMLAICMLTKSIDSVTAIDGAGDAVDDRLTFGRVGVGAPFESAGKQAVWYPAQWP